MCPRCKDRGWRGGDIGGPYAAPYRWCECSAAAEFKFANPDWVAEANRKRDDLIRMFLKQQPAQMALADDEYRGEF